MHPQLDSPRFISCTEVIRALEECHQKSYLQRCFGACNNEKEALTKCLHEARLETQRHLIIQKKEKQKKMNETLKKLKEEEYGEDELLKKLLAREKSKRAGQ